ncbi:alpha/beta hydrolases superfamily protein [Tanacetum coccineum]
MKLARKRLSSCVMDIDPARIPMVNLAIAFANKGISAFRFDFTGNGDSGGSFQYGNNYREVDDLRSVMQCFEQEKRFVTAIIGYSKGGNVVLFYALRFKDVNNVVNISGRFDLRRGIEGHLGKDYLKRMKQYGFIDVANRKGKLYGLWVHLAQSRTYERLALLQVVLRTLSSHPSKTRRSAKQVRNFSLCRCLPWGTESECSASSWESAGVDSIIFTKTWVDSAGSEGLKDHSVIDRWQSQTAAADSDFFNRLHVRDEDDSNIKELVDSQTGGVDNIKQSVVDYVVSLLMPLYKPRKFDKESHGADKAMAVFEFLDFKRKNKISIGVEYQEAILGCQEVTLGSSS